MLSASNDIAPEPHRPLCGEVGQAGCVDPADDAFALDTAGTEILDKTKDFGLSREVDREEEFDLPQAGALKVDLSVAILYVAPHFQQSFFEALSILFPYSFASEIEKVVCDCSGKKIGICEQIYLLVHKKAEHAERI